MMHATAESKEIACQRLEIRQFINKFGNHSTTSSDTKQGLSCGCTCNVLNACRLPQFRFPCVDVNEAFSKCRASNPFPLGFTPSIENSRVSVRLSLVAKFSKGLENVCALTRTSKEFLRQNEALLGNLGTGGRAIGSWIVYVCVTKWIYLVLRASNGHAFKLREISFFQRSVRCWINTVCYCSSPTGLPGKWWNTVLGSSKDWRRMNEFGSKSWRQLGMAVAVGYVR